METFSATTATISIAGECLTGRLLQEQLLPSFDLPVFGTNTREIMPHPQFSSVFVKITEL
jgi:hypothetical protein